MIERSSSRQPWEKRETLHSYRFFGPPGPRMDVPHVHNDIELNFVVSGRLTYLYGHRHLSFMVGSLCLFWAAIPHQLIQMTAETQYYAVHVPLSYFLHWRLPQDFTRHILLGEVILSANEEDEAFNRPLFGRWHRHIHRPDPAYQRATLLEIEATLRCLALSANTIVDETVDGLAGNGVEEIELMVETITNRFQEPLTVSDVAASVNLHPNYAMQLFRRYTGRTIINYLNQYRIAHAQQLLLTTDKSVLDIAYESGYNSLSRFYAVFRETCRVSPGRYRQTLGQKM